MKQAIYLDYNATAPIRPEVIETATHAMETAHNASSPHHFGRAGRMLIETARDQIAKLTNIPAAQILFNSGATEGNNTVLQHFANQYPTEKVLVSAIEHPSVLQALSATSTKIETIPVTREGVIDIKALEILLKNEKTSLVSTMLVNNETGVIQPIKDISDLTHRHGALLHVDAAQAAGRTPIDMQALGIDFLTLSSHKIAGPQGVGALCLGLCGITPTLVYGGGQEKSARAGTENVAGIAGFGTAAEYAQNTMPDYHTQTAALQKKLENKLSEYDGVHIYGQDTSRVTNTTLISLPGLSSETLLMAFDLEGIAISNGAACSSGKVEPSHVLKAMGEEETTAKSALRISTGWNSTEQDIDSFLDAFHKIYDRMKDKITN